MFQCRVKKIITLIFTVLVDEIDGNVAACNTYNFWNRFAVKGKVAGLHSALAQWLANYILQATSIVLMHCNRPAMAFYTCTADDPMNGILCCLQIFCILIENTFTYYLAHAAVNPKLCW